MFEFFKKLFRKNSKKKAYKSHNTKVSEISLATASKRARRDYAKTVPRNNPTGRHAPTQSDEDFALSMAVAAATDNALIGAAVGGSFAGGVAGDIANDGDLDFGSSDHHHYGDTSSSFDSGGSSYESSGSSFDSGGSSYDSGGSSFD